ncbi:amino acid permease-domain-containing protein [Crassisporium funariophilum]|nr:amino acid permease-domain-containing protein [Crassisporium funariophilum]
MALVLKKLERNIILVALERTEQVLSEEDIGSIFILINSTPMNSFALGCDWFTAAEQHPHETPCHGGKQKHPTYSVLHSSQQKLRLITLLVADLNIRPTLKMLLPDTTNEMQSSNRNEVLQRDEALLASLGYKQELKRPFTPFEIFGVSFSVIGLLPSMASVLFYAIPNGGGPAMVWGWLVGSVFAMFIGLAMSELASAYPTAGGLYYWTYYLASPRYRNLLCWIVGYANTIGTVAALASVDWGCAVQIMAAVSIGSSGTFEPTSAQTFGVYAAIILSHAVLCCFGTFLLARLQTVFVVLNILLSLIVIVALPAATPQEFRNPPQIALKDFYNAHGWTDGYAFVLSLLTPLWTICGFDFTVHMSEEASNAATAIPQAIIWAIGTSGVLGFAISMALVFCMGGNLESLVESDQPMAEIFLNGFGRTPTLALWSFVVIAQYMIGANILLASSRQVFAFSRDRALPFSGWLYRINAYTKTPVNTVWFAAALSTALGLLVFAGPVAVNAVFSLVVTSLYFAYVIPISARFIGQNNFKPGPFSMGVMSLPINVVAVAFMAFMGIVFLFPTSPQTHVADMNYTVVVLGGVVLLSLVWYYFPIYGGVHWFTGPVANIGDTLSSFDRTETDLPSAENEKRKEVQVDILETV